MAITKFRCGHDLGVAVSSRKRTARASFSPATIGSKKPPGRAVAREAPEGGIEGGLIAVTLEGLIGWSRDRDRPDRIVHVVLLINGLPAGVALADRFDIAEVRAQVGPGVPGFVVSLRPQPADSYPLHLTLRDVQGSVIGTELVIKDEKSFIHTAEEDSLAYEGMVDGLRDGVVLGWARSRVHPEKPIIVELYDGMERLARQLANGFRDDLKAAGKGRGNCAFAFDLPISILDGRQHHLRVMVAGTMMELRNSPIQFGRLTAASMIEELVRLRQETERLRKLVGRIAAADGTIQSELVRTVCERVTAFSEIQREMLARELSAIRRLAVEPRLVARGSDIARIDVGASGQPVAGKNGRHA